MQLSVKIWHHIFHFYVHFYHLRIEVTATEIEVGQQQYGREAVGAAGAAATWHRSSRGSSNMAQKQQGQQHGTERAVAAPAWHRSSRGNSMVQKQQGSSIIAHKQQEQQQNCMEAEGRTAA